MPDPWTIIGWTIIGVPVASVGVILILYLVGVVRVLVKYRRTRDIPPRAGQVWAEGTKTVWVVDVDDDTGRVLLNVSRAPFGIIAVRSESPTQWREAVRQNWRWLRVDTPKGGKWVPTT